MSFFGGGHIFWRQTSRWLFFGSKQERTLYNSLSSKLIQPPFEARNTPESRSEDEAPDPNAHFTQCFFIEGTKKVKVEMPEVWGLLPPIQGHPRGPMPDPYCDKMHVYPAKNQRWQFKVHIYFLAHARRRMKFPLKVLSSNRWYVFFFSLPQREIFEQKSFFQDPGSKTAKYYAVCFVKASQQWYSFIELSSRELTYPPKMAFWRWFSFFWGGIC